MARSPSFEGLGWDQWVPVVVGISDIVRRLAGAAAMSGKTSVLWFGPLAEGRLLEPGAQPSGRMAGRIVACIEVEVVGRVAGMARAGVDIVTTLADKVVVGVVWAAALARGVALGPAPSGWC